MESVTPYINPYSALLDWSRARSSPTLLTFAAVPLLTGVETPSFLTATLTLQVIVLLGYLSPRPSLRPSTLFASLWVSLLGVVAAFCLSWLTVESSSVYNSSRVLQKMLETLCTGGSLRILFALWALGTIFSVIRNERGPKNLSDSPKRATWRKRVGATLVLFICTHLILFSLPHLGPVECPEELQFENLPKIKRISLGDSKVEMLAPKRRLPNSLWLQALEPESRDYLYEVAAKRLGDLNYRFGDQELYLTYVLAKDLDQWPPTAATCKFSAALLAFARHHKREFLWGPELRYFWRQTLPYLSTHPPRETEQQLWTNYQAGLHLDQDTEICSVRYFSDWTCARSHMTLFGRRFETSPIHLWRNARIRWASLFLGTAKKERAVRRANPEFAALSELLGSKRRKATSKYLNIYTYDDRINLHNPDSPAIFRGSLTLEPNRSTGRVSGTKMLPESMCRCERPAASEPRE